MNANTKSAGILILAICLTASVLLFGSEFGNRNLSVAHAAESDANGCHHDAHGYHCHR